MTNKEINVLSLFNGMGTLRQAFSDLNIKVGKYYSSEIKPAAIELQQYHFPDVIQLGNINNWKEWDIDWKSIDFIGSGSPCQDLSIAGKRKGLNGERSSLFWLFIDILNYVKKINPNVIFLQENVCSAPQKDIGIMSRAMGVYPVKINSNLVTAQNRCRYYWTNIRTKQYGLYGDLITDIPQPKDKHIYFKDIIENGYINKEKANCLLESESRISTNQKSLKKRVLKGLNNAVFVDENKLRILNKTELCRLQGFPDNYCNILTRNNAASLLGDGWTLPVIKHILSFYDN